MNPLGWIVGLGLIMVAISLTGSLALTLREGTLERILSPLVAFAAGALLGGAFLHMIPEAVIQMSNSLSVWVLVLSGFLLFFIFEQFLHWHHSHHPTERQPVTYLVLIADALHNFIGGASIGATFLIDVRLGVAAWFAAVAHEIPQELGDFAVLVRGGWSKTMALSLNFISALTFPIGGLLTYFMSRELNLTGLVPFAAGNFIYIASADLIPEIKQSTSFSQAIMHLLFVLLGLGLLLGVRIIYGL